ncbi:unnamed protein product, partial [Urochloa humidicola]
AGLLELRPPFPRCCFRPAATLGSLATPPLPAAAPAPALLIRVAGCAGPRPGAAGGLEAQGLAGEELAPAGSARPSAAGRRGPSSSCRSGQQRRPATGRGVGRRSCHETAGRRAHAQAVKLAVRVGK